jgi:hypothetical protein
MTTDQGGVRVPALVAVGSLIVDVAPPVDLGASPLGRRRMVAILGGTLSGELGTGVVLPGGADWQTLHDDGTVSVDAHYSIRLVDDVVITLRSSGVRSAGAAGEPGYFRASVLLTAPPARDDLNRALFLSSGVRTGGTVRLDLYRVT